jgi:hypothetical protein
VEELEVMMGAREPAVEVEELEGTAAPFQAKVQAGEFLQKVVLL